MTQRDIFSILEDGQPFKAEQKLLRRDRKGPKVEKEKKVVLKKVKKEQSLETNEIKPETDYTSDG